MLLVKFSDIREDFDLREKVAKAMHDGKIFVYPTDTIYGLGCDAMQPARVRRIREIKQTDHPFSVIAPSMGWIRENFDVRHEDYFKKFPGPVTLILRKKDPDFLRWVSDSDSLGVRIPNHHFTKFLQREGMPFVTTSVNVTGQGHISRIGDINEKMISRIDVVIDAGILSNPPSSIYDLSGPKPVVIRGNGFSSF